MEQNRRCKKKTHLNLIDMYSHGIIFMNRVDELEIDNTRDKGGM